MSGTVNVGNFPSAAQPFQAGTGSSGVAIPDGEVGLIQTFVVPAGKRLVIQHVSGQIRLPSGQKPFGVIVDTELGTSFQRYFLEKPEQKSVATYFQFGEEITINAGPGTVVRVVFSRFGGSTAGVGSFQWAVSGYLTNV